MKKINLLFVLFFVFAVNAMAQKKSKTKVVVDEEYLNSIVVSENNSFSSLSLASGVVAAPPTAKALQAAKKNDEKKGLTTEKVFVPKTGSFNKANPVYNTPVVGNPASLSNQPLKKYNEDLVPIKVSK